jgi:hypothetical protein
MVKDGWNANEKIKKLPMVKSIDAGVLELKFKWPIKEL